MVAYSTSTTSAGILRGILRGDSWQRLDRTYLGVLLKQHLADLNGRRLARVSRVLLEREAKHRDALA
jgi:hypothetical protein